MSKFNFEHVLMGRKDILFGDFRQVFHVVPMSGKVQIFRSMYTKKSR